MPTLNSLQGIFQHRKSVDGDFKSIQIPNISETGLTSGDVNGRHWEVHGVPWGSPHTENGNLESVLSRSFYRLLRRWLDRDVGEE